MLCKALIPIAGLGTRMGPLARAVPKALFALADAQNRLLPVVHVIINDAIAAGITKIGLVVSQVHIEMVKRYFSAAAEHYGSQLDEQIEYIVLSELRGFGDAVACGADFVGGEPFVVLLGDHVYVHPDDVESCTGQVLAAFVRHGGRAMIGVQDVNADELQRVGVVTGEPLGDNTFRCTRFVEKPNLETARQCLATAGLAKDRFLAHCGIYIFTPDIFECLEELRADERLNNNEIELAQAQSMLLGRYPKEYYLHKIEGRAYDTGTPAGYLRAQKAIADGAVLFATIE